MLSHQLKVATWTAPSNIWVALFTTDPGNAGAGTEVTGGSYARINHNAWIMTVGNARQAESNTAITFAAATAGWGTVTHFGLFDAVTGGNYLVGGTLTVSKTVSNTDVVSFADGQITIAIA